MTAPSGPADRWSFVPPGPTLDVHRWTDPFVETHQHAMPAGDIDAELYWLPIIGPTAFLVGRRLAHWLDGTEIIVVGLDVLAKMLGVGNGDRVGAALPRAMNRLVGFNLARWQRGDLGLRTTWPPLTARQFDRLPEALQLMYVERTRAEVSA